MNEDFLLLLSLAGTSSGEVRGFASEVPLEAVERELMQKAASGSCSPSELDRAIQCMAKNATALEFFAELLAD
ncbi:MAG: hypothetical protein ACI9R3_001748 [Verrucomicrobiales bacterium]|jgi:hypothetical protein